MNRFAKSFSTDRAIKPQPVIQKSDFDLSGNNCVIKDTQFDHLTKVNFKNTLRQIAASNNSNLYPMIF